LFDVFFCAFLVVGGVFAVSHFSRFYLCFLCCFFFFWVIFDFSFRWCF
jgi:hypothetical protein